MDPKIISTFWNNWKYKDCTAISPLKTQLSESSKSQADGPPCMLKSRARYQLLYGNVKAVSRKMAGIVFIKYFQNDRIK
jgi:hypothetical protein